MHSKLILLVEDNPDDEDLTLDALRGGGITSQIVVARDGDEALRMLHPSSSQLPDLVLLDLRLPKVPGLEVLRRMRANTETKYIPTVVLTSSSEQADIVASYRDGANSYVRKPVQYERFVEAVQTLGAYWVLYNEDSPPCR